MSRKASPTLIGIFVFAAIIILVAGLGFLGSSALFTRKELFICYFDQSVNGLTVGGQVKFKGVPIGRVKDILIRFNQDDDSEAVPVIMEINLDKLAGDLGVGINLSNDEVMKAQVLAGLRAQLRLESFITGILYIELDYFPGSDFEFEQEEFVYKEIPTIPTADIGGSASDLIAQIAAIDFGEISERLSTLLTTLNERASEVDFIALQEAFVGVAGSLEELASAPETREALRNFGAAMERIETLAAGLDEKVSPELVSALRQAETTLVQVESMIRPNSPLRFELENALEKLATMAESISLLADYLERNPNALLSGKPAPSAP